MQEYHRLCASCIGHLMKGEYGVVSSHSMYLQDLGRGKPGDDICLLTHRYANLLLEEESSSNINSIFQAEEMEREIERRFKEKDYYKKFERTHTG